MASALDRDWAPDAEIAHRAGDRLVRAFLEIDLGNWKTDAFGRRLEGYVPFWRGDRWHALGRPDLLVVAQNDERARRLRDIAVRLLEIEAPWLAEVPVVLFTSTARVLGGAGPLGTIWQMTERPGLHSLLWAAGSTVRDPAEAR
jgi:hypothetical protein